MDNELNAGPLKIKEAGEAVRDAAIEGERTAAKAGALIDLATEMLRSFKNTWGWLLFRK